MLPLPPGARPRKKQPKAPPDAKLSSRSLRRPPTALILRRRLAKVLLTGSSMLARSSLAYKHKLSSQIFLRRRTSSCSSSSLRKCSARSSGVGVRTMASSVKESSDSGSFDYDLFTIGAGSGGVRASRMSAAAGGRVAICEMPFSTKASDSAGGAGGSTRQGSSCGGGCSVNGVAVSSDDLCEKSAR